MSVVSPHNDNHVFDNHNSDEMDWTPQKEQLLEDYIVDYYQKLNDTRLFYKNLDWNRVYSIVGVDDQEFLRLKIDEVYDNFVNKCLGDDFNVDQLVMHWKSKKNPIFQEVVQMVESLGLEEFKLDQPREPEESVEKQQPQLVPVALPKLDHYQVSEPVKKVKSPPVPQLTRTERRVSLELMHPKPTFGVHRELPLAKAPVAATTNINVLAKPEAGTLIKKTTSPTKKRFSFKQQKPVTPFIVEPNTQRPKTRRTSTVDEQLPTYIRNQLTKNRPRQKLTPKPSKRHVPAHLSNESSLRGSYKKTTSRLQNLVTNSQSLYAHNKDLTNSGKSSPANTFDSDQRLQYFSDESDGDDTKEYILPDLLTRYIGMHIDHDDEDDDDEEGVETDNNDHENDEDDHDFVNVGEEDDDDDYLFKI
ncbi:hypothetical protein Cantr_04432 [Candida viswanathii]|uniref:Uncharacterized protein n=1 Tax=Candida viswanathii TaxID=5486 RepID=A0A367XP72_9ASCO|nr:hypothetical protein Cantr_04432 [Candida viswanathii]